MNAIWLLVRSEEVCASAGWPIRVVPARATDNAATHMIDFMTAPVLRFIVSGNKACCMCGCLASVRSKAAESFDVARQQPGHGPDLDQQVGIHRRHDPQIEGFQHLLIFILAAGGSSGWQILLPIL